MVAGCWRIERGREGGSKQRGGGAFHARGGRDGGRESKAREERGFVGGGWLISVLQEPLLQACLLACLLAWHGDDGDDGVGGGGVGVGCRGGGGGGHQNASPTTSKLSPACDFLVSLFASGAVVSDSGKGSLLKQTTTTVEIVSNR